MNQLKIKVCGMREPDNIAGVANACPDYMGFIFYEPSKRFVGFEPQNAIFSVPESVVKVGVFVNEQIERILQLASTFELEAIQLHGNESPEMCHQLQKSGLTVFKAFAIDKSFDFNTLNQYTEVCDFFLFDTKGALPGGTGKKFDWQLLDNYQLKVPFFLSGGITPDDLETISRFEHPRWRGLDINSGFELSPGYKDVWKVRKFIEIIRHKSVI